MLISSETKIRLFSIPSLLFYAVPSAAVFAARNYIKVGKEAALITLGINVAYQVGVAICNSSAMEKHGNRHSFKVITLCQAAVVALAVRTYKLSLANVIFCLGAAMMANKAYGLIEETFGWHNPRLMGQNFEDIDDSDEISLAGH